jgi:hypothetical protein
MHSLVSRVAGSWQWSAVLVVVFSGGCATGRPVHSGAKELGIASDYRYEVLWSDMREYAITFDAEVEAAANRIRASCDDARIRRNALLWKARSIPEMQKACFRPDPLAALFDVWVFSRQMQDFFSSGAGAEAFGPFQAEVVAVCNGLVERILMIRDSVRTGDDAMSSTESEIIEPWIAAHPIADFSFNRESAIAPFSKYAREGASTFQSVSNINEQITLLTNMLRMALANMPKQVQWEAALILQELAKPEEIAGLLADVGRITDAVERAVDVAEQVPDLVQEEREVVLREMDRQRTLLVDVLASERQAVLEAISKERTEILLAVDFEREQVLKTIADERAKVIENVDAQRLDTLGWAEGERGIVLDTLGEEIDGVVDELRSERALILDEVRSITDQTLERADGELEELLDQALIRIALLVALCVVAAPFVAHVYARVWPRRA